MPCPALGSGWGAGWWGDPRLSHDTCMSPPLQVDFTSCTGLFCVLGIVVMVTGIITAIVLSFKYVSGGVRGAAGCHGSTQLGFPGAVTGRGDLGCSPLLGCRVWCWTRQRQLACRERVCWCQHHRHFVGIQAEPALPCLLPASTQLTLPVSPSPRRSPGSTCCMLPLVPSHSPW